MLLDRKTVLYFDGVCVFCNKVVLFIVKQDKHKRILFATLQNIENKRPEIFSDKTLSTVILWHNGKYYYKTDVLLQVIRLLGGWWRLLLIIGIVPRFLRNFIYDFIARNRYYWFGKKAECILPTPELEARIFKE